MYVISHILTSLIFGLICISGDSLIGPTLAAFTNGTNSTTGKKVLNFMAFFSVGSKAWSGVHDCVNSTYLAMEHVNKRNDILADYELKMTRRDTKCLSGVAADVMYEMLYQPPTKVMVFGAGCSACSMATAQSSHLWNLTQLSFGSSAPALSSRKKYPRFFRTTSSATFRNVARVFLMDLYKWKKVSTIHETSELYSDVTYDLLDRLKETNTTLITAEVFRNDPTLQLQNLLRHDARIIVGGFYENRVRQVLCQSYRMGLRWPKVVWMLPAWYAPDFWQAPDPLVPCSLEEMNAAVEGTVLVSHTYSNPEQLRGISGYTSNEWIEMFMAYRNISRANAKANCYDTIWSMALALNKTVQVMAERGYSKTLDQFEYMDSDINDIITESMDHLSFVGVIGEIDYRDTREGMKMLKVEHVRDGVRKIIGIFNPLKPVGQQMYWIGDGLQWPGGRIPKDSYVYIHVKHNVSLQLYISMSILAVIGILMTLGFLAFNIIFREKRIIKLSSPNMNNLILIGGLECYVTVFLEPLDSNVLVFCQVKTFMIAIGFSTMYGALLSKTWRVHRIFSNKKLKQVKIKDSQLLITVCCLIALETLVLLIWDVIDQWQVVTVEAYREVSREDADIIIIGQLDVCESVNQTYFMAVMYSLNGLVLAFGAFLAWETKKVKVEALNDSQFIGLSIYNAAILSGVVALLSTVLTNQRNLVFGLTSGFLMLGVAVTQLLIFVPKVLNLNSNQVFIGEATDGTKSITRNTTNPSLAPQTSK